VIPRLDDKAESAVPPITKESLRWPPIKHMFSQIAGLHNQSGEHEGTKVWKFSFCLLIALVFILVSRSVFKSIDKPYGGRPSMVSPCIQSLRPEASQRPNERWSYQMAVLVTGDLGLAVVALVIDGQARCDCRLGLKCPVCGNFARKDKCRIAKAHAELFP